MSKISPKIIDVEGNRVEGEIYKRNNIIKNRSNLDYVDGTYGGGKGFGAKDNYDIVESSSRFPTQLFTNIKNNQFKYVKNIT